MDDREDFDDIIARFDTEVLNIAAHLEWEAGVRAEYRRRIAAMKDDYIRAVQSGEMTWKDAARGAARDRNQIMEVLRGRSSPAGRSLAQAMKKQGPDLNTLVAKQVSRDFPGRSFQALSEAERGAIYRKVIESAARDRGSVSLWLARLRPAARGLAVLSLASSVYTVATAENKLEAAAREGSMLAASAAGASAGGIAGLACGPGAVVCVPLFAFVGGALAAWGVDSLW